MPKGIVDTSYTDIMGQSYIDYAMSVITERALPDIRDGLKPVQRRVIYSVSELTKHDTPYRKCARIVGDTMGKYHPHGDSSIYGALVYLAQKWVSENPLIDPHGNFGAVDGSGAAAMRYTEARISKYTEDACIKDLPYFKDLFRPNFDNTETEPDFLPFQIPNLLVNGSTGIAVGMATNIPSHNLAEVVDAFTAYLNNEDISLDELLLIMPAPDFATGGIINSTPENLREIYATGRGRLKVRGKVEVKDAGHGRKSICVTELPPAMIGGTEKFLETVAELVRTKQLPSSIVDIADRGGKDGECLAIDVKKGTSDDEINEIINILYKKTSLEDTFGVNFNCITDKRPKVVSLLEYFKQYAAFKYEIYDTKYRKLLLKQKDIYEVKKGLVEAIDVIDLIIEILRGSKNVKDAKECLMYGKTDNIKFRFKGSKEDAQSLSFTEKQADAILSMKLQRLIGLELDVLKKELAEAEGLIKKYEKLLSSKTQMKQQIIKDMKEIKNEHAVQRKTEVSNLGNVEIKGVEEKAVPVAVLLDRFYYLKVIDAAVYDKNIESITKDYRFAFRGVSTDRLGIFTDDNNMYMVKLSDVLKQQIKKNTTKGSVSLTGKLSDKGIQIFEFCGMKGNENVLYMGIIETFKDLRLMFVTEKGFAKRVEGAAFDTMRKCISAFGGDGKVVSVSETTDSDFTVVKTLGGFYERVESSDIPIQGKAAGGVKLISLSDGDTISGVCTGNVKSSILSDAGTEIPFTRIKTVKRGGKGIKLRI